MAVEYFVTKDGRIGVTLDSVVDVIDDQMRITEENTRAEYQWYGAVEEMPNNYFAARGAIAAIGEAKEELLERFANIGDLIDQARGVDPEGKEDREGDGSETDEVHSGQGTLPAGP